MESMTIVRQATAQANTGQTDTVQVPAWAKQAVVYINLTAVAGTTPLFDCKFQYVEPIAGTLKDFQWNGITQATAAVLAVVNFGAGNIDTEDDVGDVYFLKDNLPPKFNIVTTLDRTTADETYTYTLAVVFRG